MKKQIISFVIGAMIFGTIGVFAGQYVATENPFPVQLNGDNVSIEGYNINDNTYFKLRDISSVVGGFDVDFNNNTIQLSKDGYVYDNTISESVDFSKYIGSYSRTSEKGTRSESTLKLDIYSIDNGTIKFNCQMISPRHIITMTSGDGYFTGDTMAEAPGTYDIDGQSSGIKYYFVFGEDYIDFKYVLYNENGETSLTSQDALHDEDNEYTRFYVNY